MGRKKKTEEIEQEYKPLKPASTVEGREMQLISAAVDLAEKQIMEGTASSQVITHFLKLGSTKNQLELEKLRAENELLKAKAEALESARNQEEMYTKAISAMREYSGMSGGDIDV